MSEPQYDQSDANLYYTMQELRELRKRVENAEATLAAIRAWAPHLRYQDETDALLALLDAPKETP